jgi:16S rRNA (adenine1518-N6/adenine1519-N6)-dimethyltransferase
LALLDGAGTRPKKRFGQNFLIDGNLMRRLVEAAEIGPNDLVLEVGPGTGGLTDLLIEQAGAVVCCEVDRDLCGILRERFGESERVRLVEGDVLAKKSALSPEVVSAIRAAGDTTSGEFLLVANLPYSIASPLLIDLVASDLGIQRLCFTVQKEVGERILAEPGQKTFGPLSVILQAVCTGRRIAKLPPEAFWPAPEVESVMLRLDVDPERLASVGDLSGLAHVVRDVFGQRRKAMGGVLRRLYGDGVVDSLEREMGLDVQRRCETLSVADWVQLAQVIHEGRDA